MTPPKKIAVRRVGNLTLDERGCHRPIFRHHRLKQSACGRGRSSRSRGRHAPEPIASCVFTREFPLRIKRRGLEMRFAIDASDPRAANPDPVLLNEV
jgi:hypothetical protein